MATGALLIVLAAHVGGSLVSGLICGFIARRVWIAAANGMGICWTSGGRMMPSILPSPAWFAVADTLLYVLTAIVGAWSVAACSNRKWKKQRQDNNKAAAATTLQKRKRWRLTAIEHLLSC